MKPAPGRPPVYPLEEPKPSLFISISERACECELGGRLLYNCYSLVLFMLWGMLTNDLGLIASLMLVAVWFCFIGGNFIDLSSLYIPDGIIFWETFMGYMGLICGPPRFYMPIICIICCIISSWGSERPDSKFSSLIPKNLSASNSSNSSPNIESLMSLLSSCLPFPSRSRALFLRNLNSHPLIFACSLDIIRYFLVFLGPSVLIRLTRVAFLMRTKWPLKRAYIFMMGLICCLILLMRAVRLTRRWRK